MIRTIILSLALLAAAPALAEPTPVEKYTPLTTTPAPTVKSEARIDINTATVDQLLTVKGLSRANAEAIVRARPFKSVDELAAGNILRADVFAMIKDRLTVTK